VAKLSVPLSPSDYRPISITPVLSRVLERIVVTDFIYPSLRFPPPFLSFADQFAFQPTGSTTAALIHLLHTVTNLLDTNPYVIVYALDFSKAFDSVRHSALLAKYAMLQIPDNIYNWVESFFKEHSHCTKFRGEISDFLNILASIIQNSAIGPASFVVTACELHPITSRSHMDKYTYDTYLIIPASNSQSCVDEIAPVEDWAINNNLALNRAKSVEIVFVSPSCRRATLIPSPAVSGFQRVETIKALGVTVSRKFSVSQHVDNLLAACAQTLFALRTLRHHGLPDDAIHVVFQAVVAAKLSYASPAWWGFSSASDRGRLEAFLRRAARLNFRPVSAPTLSCICNDADDRLFNNILHNSHHILSPLLPPLRYNQYSMRNRPHNRQLPVRSSVLTDNNFIMRMLYKNLV